MTLAQLRHDLDRKAAADLSPLARVIVHHQGGYSLYEVLAVAAYPDANFPQVRIELAPVTAEDAEEAFDPDNAYGEELPF